MVFKDREKESEGEDSAGVKSEKMDAMRHTLPRLQLTVPMPIKMGKVGLTFDFTSGCFSSSLDERRKGLISIYAMGTIKKFERLRSVGKFLKSVCLIDRTSFFKTVVWVEHISMFFK